MLISPKLNVFSLPKGAPREAQDGINYPIGANFGYSQHLHSGGFDLPGIRPKSGESIDGITRMLGRHRKRTASIFEVTSSGAMKALTRNEMQ